MVLAFKNETFRDDFTFSNSVESIRRFPFPFHEDKYMYAVNIEPHVAGPKGSVYEFPIDIDEHYVSEMRDRALVLDADPVRCQALPHMKQQRWGRIINITSEVYHRAVSPFSAYVAAKGGQIGWSRSMSRELAPFGITVNTVAPGWIPVERHEKESPQVKAAYQALIPAGRWGVPQDVADAVLYLASPEASFVTGQTLCVNGGMTPW